MAEVTRDRVETDIGDETLFDLPYGDPPEQLLDGVFLTPEGWTVMYANGGTGKGVLSTYFAMRMIRERDFKVMVLDYEYHPREWSNRARGMGYADEELKSAPYRSPFSPRWKANRGDIAEVADLVQANIEKIGGIDYLIVDSFTTASQSDSEMGGARGAQEFFGAVTQINQAGLVLAHTAGGGQRFPDKPFGSSFVHNLARETWALEQNAMEQVELAKGTLRFQPHVIKIEARNMKRNDGPKAPHQFFTVSFQGNGDIDVDRAAPTKRSHKDLILEVLERAKDPLDVNKIAKAIKDDTGEVLSPENVRTVFSRYSTLFASTRDTPKRWSLRRVSHDEG